MVFFSVYSIVVQPPCSGTRPETPDSFRVQKFPSRQFRLLTNERIHNSAALPTKDGHVSKLFHRKRKKKKKKEAKFFSPNPDRVHRRSATIFLPRGSERYNQHLTDKYDNKCIKCP